MRWRNFSVLQSAADRGRPPANQGSPEAVRSAGRIHYVARPGTRTWVRLGDREWRLLQRIRGSGVREIVDRDPDGWSPEDVATAFARFRSLGLLTADPNRPAGGRTCVQVPALAGLGGMLLGLLAVEVLLISRTIPWQAALASRPSGWLTAVLLVLMAVLHETGHAAVASAVGHPPAARRVGVGWFGWIPLPALRLEHFWALSKAQRTAVVLAGAGAQVLLASAAAGLWLGWLVFSGSPPPMPLLWVSATAIILAAVNLLPMYPLDGYWLTAVRLDRPRLREESRLVRIFSVTGLIGLWALTMLWIVSLFT